VAPESVSPDHGTTSEPGGRTFLGLEALSGPPSPTAGRKGRRRPFVAGRSSSEGTCLWLLRPGPAPVPGPWSLSLLVRNR
jgi:hypothetical protein